MKRTLIICPEYPLPESSGTNIRTMNFVRFFMTQGAVDIACPDKPTIKQPGGKIFSNEHFFGKHSPNGFRWRFVKGLFDGVPFPVQGMQKKQKQYLIELITKGCFDYILMRYVHYTHALYDVSSLIKLRTIVDVDDILSQSMYQIKFNSVKGMLKKIIIEINKERLITYEKKCFNFGTLLFCSGEDLNRFTPGKKQRNTCIVPNIYRNLNFEDYDFKDGFNNKNILLFVGMLNYKPNIEGLFWFMESVFPAFKNIFDDAKLLVVGRSPRSEVKERCKREDGIILYSDVDDIRKYYRKCRAVVVPLLSGSGTRIKILEAVSANRPVLSTPMGLEGIKMLDGKDILIFKNAHEFHLKYQHLYQEDFYSSLIRNAKKTVQAQYSEKQFNEAMTQVLRKVDEHTAQSNPIR